MSRVSKSGRGSQTASPYKRQLPYVCDDCHSEVGAVISNVVKLDVQVVAQHEHVCQDCFDARLITVH